jgi:hypothetical protein
MDRLNDSDSLAVVSSHIVEELAAGWKPLQISSGQMLRGLEAAQTEKAKS